MSVRKNILPKLQIMTLADMSAGPVRNSKIVNISYLDNIGLEFICTVPGGDTVTGTISIQASIDHVEDAQGNILVTGTFINIPGVTAPTVSATGAFNALVHQGLSNLPYPYLQVTYLKSSGTSGTLDVYLSAKTI